MEKRTVPFSTVPFSISEMNQEENNKVKVKNRNRDSR